VSGAPRAAFAVGAGVVVLGAIVAGLLALGSPAEERARRLDQRRLEDLRQLATGIEVVWSTEQRLPRTLDELPKGFATRRDPETGQSYEYSLRGETRYQLCATFDRDVTSEATPPSPGAHWLYLTFWTHGAGRTCFEVEPKGISD
jgi:hypothetical protein